MKKLLAMLLVFIMLCPTGIAQEENPVFAYSYTVLFSPKPWHFDFKLYENGLITYESWVFDTKTLDKVERSEKFNIAPEYVKEIIEVIEQGNISDIPAYLNTKTEDAPAMRFNFNGKEIYGEGIYYIDPLLFFKYNFGIEDFFTATYLNRTLKLFSGIQEVFARAGYKLETYGFETMEE